MNQCYTKVPENVELNGFNSNPSKVAKYRNFGLFWLLIFYIIFSVWAGNNIAVFLDDQGVDRYFTFTFWRLVSPILSLILTWPFVLLLVKICSEFAQRLACLSFTIVTLFLGSVCLFVFYLFVILIIIR